MLQSSSMNFYNYVIILYCATLLIIKNQCMSIVVYNQILCILSVKCFVESTFVYIKPTDGSNLNDHG